MSSDAPKFSFGATSSSKLFGAGQSTASNVSGGGDAAKSAGMGFNFAGFGTSSAGEDKTSNGASADKKQSGGFGSFGTGTDKFSLGGTGASQTPSKFPLDGANAGEVKGSSRNAQTGGSTSAPAGSTTPAPSGLSFNKPSTTPAGPPPTNLFAGSTGGNGLFTNKDKDKSAAHPFQSFGAASGTGTTQPSASGATHFGGDTAKQPFPTFSWSKPAETSQGTTSGTTASAEPQKPLFGALGQSASSTPSSSLPSTEAQKPFFSGFGQKPSTTPASSTPSTTSATPSFFFQPATSGGTDKSQPFQFPSLTSPTTGPPTTQTEKSQPLFGTSASQTPSTSAPTFGNLFNQTPTSSSATASASLFSPGVTTPATSGSQAPTSSTAPTATSTAPFSSLFKKPNIPSSSATTSAADPTATSVAAPAPTSTAGGGTSSDLGKSVLGASTAGPAPPAQSRLRNKTMDEILTRWASDLTKYTKEFQSHAQTVAHWDQLLVENMSKISKLYISAVTAEKQTASVEMQLTAVENQQNELESWLTKYEGEVDDMLAKSGAGQGMELGVPDQERERTYKLAERLGERLEDMGRDLTSMIEEINAANAGLSKPNKADEPAQTLVSHPQITQIVRILNSHLSQLQAIDQGTVALQAKVNAAQKASQGLGFPATNGSNGAASGAADDFYRSYMGRR